MSQMETMASAWAPRFLSVLRIVTGLLFMEHGTAKLFHFPVSQGEFPLLSLMGIGGVLEAVGGALIVVGFLTRPTAFILSGQMAVAYFMFHAPENFYPMVNNGDAAILYSFIFLYLVAAGAGPLSVDAIRGRR